MELLTIDYFTFTTQHMNVLHCQRNKTNTVWFLNGTLRICSFGRNSGESVQFSNRQPIVWRSCPFAIFISSMGALTMCSLLLYVLTFKYTTCSTFKTTLWCWDDKGKQRRVSRSQDPFPGTPLQSLKLSRWSNLSRRCWAAEVGSRRGKFRVHVRGVSVIPWVPFFLLCYSQGELVQTGF